MRRHLNEWCMQCGWKTEGALYIVPEQFCIVQGFYSMTDTSSVCGKSPVRKGHC